MALTVVEKILLAAYALEEGGQSPFTAEQLIVKTWQTDHDLFGLQGYAKDYPDSNRILTNIMGRKGLAGRGWIERVGQKRYTLTAAGSRAALRITGDPVGPTYAGGLARKEVTIAMRLLQSPAFEKHQTGQDDGIIFRDACSFWGISNYSTARVLRDRFVEIRDLLQEVDTAISESPTRSITLPERKVTLDDKTAQALRNTHDFLQKKFFNELNVIRNRS